MLRLRSDDPFVIVTAPLSMTRTLGVVLLVMTRSLRVVPLVMTRMLGVVAVGINNGECHAERSGEESEASLSAESKHPYPRPESGSPFVAL